VFPPIPLPTRHSLRDVRTNQELLAARLASVDSADVLLTRLMETTSDFQIHDDGIGIPASSSSRQDQIEALLLQSEAPNSTTETLPTTHPKCQPQTCGERPFDSKTQSRKQKAGGARETRYIAGEFAETDVLLGRGGLANNHPGNKAYQRQKEEMQARYLASSKEQKTIISMELVEFIHARGGRFLKLDRRTQRWFEITDKEARRKASQTLRDINTPERRAEKRVKYSHKKNG